MFVDGMLSATRKRFVAIGDDAALIDAARLLLDPAIDLIVVHDPDGLLAGVITKTDVVRRISQCSGSACATASSMVMIRDVVFCRTDAFLHEVWSLMKERGLKNIPVVGQDSRAIGVLNARDALEVLMQEAESEESLLRDYVMCVGYH